MLFFSTHLIPPLFLQLFFGNLLVLEEVFGIEPKKVGTSRTRKVFAKKSEVTGKWYILLPLLPVPPTRLSFVRVFGFVVLRLVIHFQTCNTVPAASARR